ncbi:Asp-tRNA(Asn)/Glu-tRNA(Gln) amidotransferase subunit GatC [Patescibacteria group bacterium]|nr:Asp-tRNA(Asn)/Glu-tRNA(Gln) amidotransferase subunit GatC [Patescibacteria group bacterium]
MTKEEIEHLARLSRIALSPAETVSFQSEITSILDYVSVVNAMAADETPHAPTVPEHINIFRADEVTNEPGSNTEVLLAAMPETHGRFMKVKKILNQND